MAFKIYTKTGDKGKTGLIGGTRVEKDHIRIDAYGTVDELNSFIGMANDQLNVISNFDNTTINDWLLEIQDRLFTIGASLATDPQKAPKQKMPDLLESDITALEEWMDRMDTELPTMKFFVLPGGHPAASTLHVARCVCRRAERICVRMSNNDEFVADVAKRYLNRLSDFLFVLSRYVIQKVGGREIPWRPRVNNDTSSQDA